MPTYLLLYNSAKENDRIKKKTNIHDNTNIPSTESIYIYICIYICVYIYIYIRK